MTYAQVKELPESLRSALKEVKYFRNDVKVEAKDTYRNLAPSGKGQRGFTLAVNLATGETESYQGSWGGSNPFVVNAIDSDDTMRQLPPGFAIVQGTQGYPRTYAVIYVNPNNIAAMLPAKAEITDRENALLAAIKSHTSAGRKHFWERYPQSKPTAEELESLVERGYLKRNKAGAVSMTTKGKNAVTIDYAVWYMDGKEKYSRS